MIGRVEVLSREELLLQTLAGLIQEVAAQGSDRYNILIAEVYAEFMRELLPGYAEGGMGLQHPESLLSLARHAIKDRVQRRLGEVQFNFFPYEQNTCEALKMSVKELHDLQGRFRDSVNREIISISNSLNPEDESLFTIAEVGLKGSEIQELIAYPCDPKCYLDFSQVAERCTVEGDWFPVELILNDPALGNLVFVVDQHGSIHIPTENFPVEAFERTRSILKNLARALYVEHPDYDDERIQM